MMFTRNEQPYGYSWEEWTTKWWKWFLAITKESHPANDKTGEKFAVGQIDPSTIFLAGTTKGFARRTIRIDATKSILFPVINATASYSENPSLKTDLELSLYAESQIDDIVRKEAAIDGIDLRITEAFRVRSPPFEFSYPSNNIFDLRAGPTRGVADGYWIYLKPLLPGTHFIRTSGACMSGKIQIGVEFQLIVEKNL